MIDATNVSRQQRLVLCPYGIVPERRALCTALLLHCGGDVSRLIDAPPGEGPFLNHLKRLTAMFDAVKAPIVLLTCVSPARERVVQLRERYESELPPLRRADWLLFVDENPAAFAREAPVLGRIERHGPTIWHTPPQRRYLVVVPDDLEPALLEAGMAALASAQDETARARVSSRRISLHHLGKR